MSDKPTIYSIQMLRALAAAIVVIAHAQVHLHVRNHIPELNPLLDLGRIGVDIFFVISGFIMVFIASDKFSKTGASLDFMIKRIIRVVPVYWIYTITLAILMFSLPQLVSQGKTVGLAHLIASLFFIPWENNIGYVKPVLSVGWTLNFEMYFYFILAILLFFPRKYFLPLLSVILISGIFIGRFLGPHPVLAYVVTSTLLLEFLMGCFIGILFTGKLKLPAWLSYFFVLLGVAGMFYSITDPMIAVPRFIKWGVSGALIVSGFLFLEKAKAINVPSLLVKLGDSSYSLYLTHIFTINALGKIWTTYINNYLMMYILASVLISPIVGHLAYVIMERPIIRFLNMKYAMYKSAKTSASTA